MPIKVSVVVNCHNGQKYLREALDSVYAQSFKDWEIIFFDNNSDDASATIANTYDEKLKYYFSSETLSLGAARRKAVELASGEWIAFLDTDDYWFSNKLDEQMSAVKNSDFVLWYAGIRDIDASGSVIREIIPRYRSGYQLAKQLTQFDINMVTAMVRKSALDENGLNFDPTIVASEEYNLFIRLAAKGPFCTVPVVLGVWRISSGTLTDRSIKSWWVDRERTLTQLVEDNPELVVEIRTPLALARARQNYYKARWLMLERKSLDARVALRKCLPVNLIYVPLYFLTFSTPLWDFFHSERIKRFLTSRVVRFSRIAPSSE